MYFNMSIITVTVCKLVGSYHVCWNIILNLRVPHKNTSLRLNTTYEYRTSIANIVIKKYLIAWQRRWIMDGVVLWMFWQKPSNLITKNQTWCLSIYYRVLSSHLQSRYCIQCAFSCLLTHLALDKMATILAGDNFRCICLNEKEFHLWR